MALPVIAGVSRCAFTWRTIAGSNPVNVMHFRSAADESDDLRAALEDNLSVNNWNMISVACQLDHLTITPLDGTSASEEFSWAGDQPDSGGDPIPACCVLVKATTHLRGRSHRGRVFLPWISETWQNAGTLDTTRRGNAQTAWVGFRDSMAVSAHAWCIASYTLGTASDVTSVLVETKTATMRRRMSVLRS